MKTAFIINGLDINNTAADDKYRTLRDAVKKAGYKVVPSTISWKHTTPTQYTEKFIQLYEGHKSSDGNVIIGNSFGAVVALLSASHTKPDLVLLCSLSPFFKEDIDNDWPPIDYMKKLGKKRLNDISRYSVSDLAKEVSKSSVKIKVLFGEKEHESSPRLVKRSKETASSIKNASLIEVKDAPHPFREPEYISGIINALP